MILEGKYIVITGGTSGIGYQLVKMLQNSNRVAIIGRNPVKLAKLSKEFPNIESYQADLADISQVETVTDVLADQAHPIDVLINNAAVQYTPTFISNEFNPTTITEEININYTSICYLIAGLLPQLNQDSKSVILNINSGLGLVPKTDSAVYCGCKGALNIFSQSLAYQLEKTQIQVQQAFLPLVETGMTTGRGQGKIPPEFAAKKIIDGLVSEREINDIGKVKLLRWLIRLMPSLARNILKGS
ncbi:SDR family oxidoreductase [Agaribacterium sp. ZY112]|uniref:SDR family oxidoreductase n=1 Tax=Agaribacterium sp. ZY112 TaxID=3233574 RepID=UPI003524BCC9